MLKKVLVFMFLTLSLFFAAPVDSKALSYNDFGKTITDSFYILSDEVNYDDEVIDYYDNEDCSGSGSLFGDPDADDESVAWLLQKLFNYIKIIGPVLIVILSSIDFARVMIDGDEKAMNGALKKLGLRLILAVLLFLIPTLVKFLLDIFGITGDPTCGIQ